MPDVDENRRTWDGSYDWASGGDEWSAAWGGTEAQWRATVLPRIQPFLPAATILEIAPGFGRWSSHLIPRCDRYFGIDLAASAVDACRSRFADAPHATFAVNDGRSLSAVPDGCVDLAFSFDSLVHVEADVIGSYLRELGRTLAPDGIAFIHHSNLGACPPVGRPARLAIAAGERLRGRSTVGLDHWRAPSMSASCFSALAADAGLRCVGQEVINWMGSRMIDCISLATCPGSRWDRPNRVVENPYFAAEAASAACLAELHAGADRPFGEDKRNRGDVRYFGSSSTMIVSKPVGPWAVSVLGPWPKWRELLRRGRVDPRA